MRLRQLAISQSVVFFAPPEVHQSILNFQSKTSQDPIDSRDVIAWLLEQTCCNIEQLQPLYISQGLEYCRRMLGAQKFPDAISSAEQRINYLKVLEQPEQYTLEKLYSPDHEAKHESLEASGSPVIGRYVDHLETMRKGLRNTSDTMQTLAHQEVEQEREVHIEVVRSKFVYSCLVLLSGDNDLPASPEDLHVFESCIYYAEEVYIQAQWPSGNM